MKGKKGSVTVVLVEIFCLVGFPGKCPDRFHLTQIRKTACLECSSFLPPIILNKICLFNVVSQLVLILCDQVKRHFVLTYIKLLNYMYAFLPIYIVPIYSTERPF